MKNKKNAAFTLIELLVVVLIIGILAAVAVPQYQTAVVKARAMALLPLLRSISDAQQRYYMANGRYTASFSDLDIGMPAGGVLSEGGEVAETLNYKDFSCYLRESTSDLYSAYCSSKVSGSPAMEKYYKDPYFICWAPKTETSTSDKIKNAVCKSITGQTEPDSHNDNSVGYRLY